MKTKAVLIRLDESTYTSLCQVAKRLGVSRTEVLRVFLNQGLAGYDRRHEEIVSRVSSLEKSISYSTELNAVTAAMVASLHQKRHDDTEKEQIYSNFEQGIALISTGLLTKRQNVSCSGVK